MITAVPTTAAYSLAAYLSSAELLDATTSTTARASINVEEPLVRSYASAAPWNLILGQSTRVQTAVSDTAPMLVGPHRFEDEVIARIAEFLELEDGWDGEDAAKPTASAVLDAVRFMRSAGDMASRLEPTLHVDGSVILEIEDGAEGSLRFRGDGTIVYATARAGMGSVPFDGFNVPEEIARTLAA
ncbi:hypothetical protein [Methylobacterium iners]|uniref:Uncharacterized protein n=1 Tax=Methylobacterium iners TaxID=418707 RepID=A0ABQ4S4U5_9HYPH|nr:hypothetical protein [Methylobacterium iners]GJD96914.1 hypothetical protein OCOJLMKI_4141 [Methylobacterium iners]